MKKLFVISFLVLAFAATALGQDKLDFRASGFIDMKTHVHRWNMSNSITGRPGIVDVVPAQLKPNGGEWNRTGSYVETRGRLKFDAVIGKALSGTFFFEMDSVSWGDNASGGAGQGSGRNQIGFWTGDRTGFEIKNLYFDAAVPYVPVPITVRFGLQPFGIRSNMFWYTDGTGVTVAAKVDPVTITALWAKAVEGRTMTSDDVDFYGLTANARISTVTVGGYGVYMNARNYPFNQTADQNTYFTTADSMWAHIWWFGVYVDGKLGPIFLNADFVYDHGDVNSKNPQAGWTNDKVKYSGWAGRIKIDFPWEAFNFGLVGHYGSGADARRTGKFGLPGAAVADPATAAAGRTSEKVSSFVVPPGSETGSFGEGEAFFGTVVTGGFEGIGYTGDGTRLSRGSAGGLWLARLYGSYKVTPDIKVTLQGIYLGDTTAHGDTFGTSRDVTGTTLKNNSTIGWEADIIGEWQIYRNLNFKASLGWMFKPGDALKFWNPVTFTNEKPKDPWAFTTALTYSF
jgi:hypothetical protein